MLWCIWVEVDGENKKKTCKPKEASWDSFRLQGAFQFNCLDLFFVTGKWNHKRPVRNAPTGLFRFHRSLLGNGLQSLSLISEHFLHHAQRAISAAILENIILMELVHDDSIDFAKIIHT